MRPAKPMSAQPRRARLKFPTPFRDLLMAACVHPLLPAFVMALSLLLCSPSLRTGLMADDYIHRAILTGQHALPGYDQPWFELFSFATPGSNHLLIADGTLPWWADPELRFSFFRPLSALTHLLDYALFPASPMLMHAHNLLWSLFALGAVYLFYRELLPRRGVAVLALLFYALSPTRAVSVSWIANRNSLIALCFAMLSVALHLRRLRGARLPWLLSPFLLALSLFSAEAGVAGMAYLVGVALFLDGRSRIRALWSLLPHLAVCVLVIALGGLLGHGVVGSAAYLDPRTTPLAFAAAFPHRAVASLAAVFAGPSADASNAYDLILPGLARWMTVACTLLIAGWIAVVLPLFKRSAAARTSATSALLALVPATVAFPSDRLLSFVGIGVMAVLAEYVFFALDGLDSRKRISRLAVPAIIILHAVVAPIGLAAATTNVGRVQGLLRVADDAIPDDVDLDERIAVFINPPQDPLVSFLPAMRTAQERARPLALRRLATGLARVAVRRTGPHRIEVMQDGGFLSQQTEQLTRNVRERPFARGDEVRLVGLRFVVLDTTADGRPERVEVVFDEAPESHRYLLRAFVHGHYEPFAMPAVGDCLELPATGFVELLLGQENPLSSAFSAREHDPTQRSLCGEIAAEAIAQHQR